MRISDWSSDVCSSDLPRRPDLPGVQHSRGRADKGRRDQAQQTGDTAMSTVAMPDHATAAEPDRATPMVRFEKVTKSYGSLAVPDQHGTASCRERVCPYGEISGGRGSFKKKQTK